MKMSRKKKAFTLVELLVVIAILAILASVSIVGYLGFTEKANKSVDEQLCTQYNTLLKGNLVSDDDISLAELCRIIDSEGFNLNEFNTASKSYTFAYNKDGVNSEVLLLSSDNGEILYPENATADRKNIWCVLDPKFKTVPNVYNYTMRFSSNYSELSNTVESQTYTIDLDKHLLMFSSNPKTNIKVINGSTVLPSSGAGNVTPVGKVELVDRANAITTKDNFVKEFTNSSNIAADGTVTVANKFSTFKDLGLDLSKQKVIFKDCIFDTTKVLLGGGATNIEFDHCKFTNSHHAPIAVDPSAAVENLYIHDCEFIDAPRGLALIGVPGVIRVEKNTFSLAKTPGDKGMRKDIAIQIGLDGDHASAKYVFSNWEDNSAAEYTLKDDHIRYIIKDNTVLSAGGFVMAHESVIDSSCDEYSKIKTLNQKRVTAIETKFFKSSNFEISGNIIADGIAKVVKDEGTANLEDTDPKMVTYNKYYNALQNIFR